MPKESVKRNDDYPGLQGLPPQPDAAAVATPVDFPRLEQDKPVTTITKTQNPDGTVSVKTTVVVTNPDGSKTVTETVETEQP